MASSGSAASLCTSGLPMSVNGPRGDVPTATPILLSGCGPLAL
jgi:hypothetical protein